jgi:Flp pilus assembly protein TadB
MIAAVIGLAAAALPLFWIDHTRAGQKSLEGPTGRFFRTVALGAILALMAAPPLVFVATIVVLGAKPISARIRSLRLDRAQVAAMPDTLEVIAMAISAGMSIGEMISLVTRCGPPPVRPLFASANRSLAVGHSRREVLYQLGHDAGVQLMPACEILIAADRDGASVALVLDRLATEAGRARRLAAEERARRAPVLMLAPLTMCSLPAVLIGTVLPLVLLSFGRTSL